MAAHFHPPAEMLMDYASGALREGPSLAIATHIALCEVCRSETEKCEAIGGTLLAQGETIAVSENCRNKVMAALDAQAEKPGMPVYDPFLCNVLPAPLRKYVGCGVSEVKWQRLNGQIDHIKLSSCQCSTAGARIMRIKPNSSLPKHTHKGNEYTIVLQGSYIDGERTYRRGDFALCDGNAAHAPSTANEECICLVVSENKPVFTGLLGRLFKILSPQ